MPTVTEGGIQLTFPKGATVRKFDDKATHEYIHVMKGVDFVVDTPDRLLFIEIKDPDHPNTRENSRDKFIRSLRSGKINESLKYKYRDSFIYEWAAGRIQKPVYYYVLIAQGSATKEELLTLSDQLRSKIPMLGECFISGCEIFNIRTWNQHLRRHGYRVTRARAPLAATANTGTSGTRTL